jgi:hypothetical protein
LGRNRKLLPRETIITTGNIDSLTLLSMFTSAIVPDLAVGQLNQVAIRVSRRYPNNLWFVDVLKRVSDML